MNLNKLILSSFSILIILPSFLFTQSNFYEPINLDTVKWSYEDFGKMWTFDNVPISQFDKKYGFTPSREWLNDIQKSALQFENGCSAAFVSEDGLILTNHHCGRNQLSSIQKEGEDILRDGFYAETMNDERKIENLYVDQLISIEDVTDKIKEYTSRGNTDSEKVRLREEIKDSLENKFNIETGLISKIITLYHGGKYSLYGYKRYNDIRLVMAPDFQIAATGWDWDNFTYPRYELDFMFYRAYDEEGKAVKCNNYFSWSNKGAEEGEPIFVVGRPGSTDRLYSIAQLEYLRDYVYPYSLIGFNKIYYAYYDMYMKNMEQEDLLNNIMNWGNTRKSYAGRLAGLNDEYIMKKKLSFQEDLISAINGDSLLKHKYGHIWNSIDSVLTELSKYSVKNTILRFDRYLRPSYYNLAKEFIKIVKQKELSDEDREDNYKSENLENTIDNLFSDKYKSELNDLLLQASISFISALFDSSDEIIQNINFKNSDNNTIRELKNRSRLFSKEDFIELSRLSFDEVKKLNDPFIDYNLYIEKITDEILGKVKSLNNSLSVLNELLGEAIYHVYGNRIPPDATSTLRISDGVIQGYEYNGTIAPGKTTYYGLWNRFESFNKKTYPWGLHERWKIPPNDFDLSTDIGFASSNDIVGGNSGSSVININRKVIGLVHDGNIESLAGHTIFVEKNNRTVATDSQGLIQALQYIYKTDALVDELLNGRSNN